MISGVIECEKIVELLPMRAKIANEPITVILHSGERNKWSVKSWSSEIATI